MFMRVTQRDSELVSHYVNKYLSRSWIRFRSKVASWSGRTSRLYLCIWHSSGRRRVCFPLCCGPLAKAIAASDWQTLGSPDKHAVDSRAFQRPVHVATCSTGAIWLLNCIRCWRTFGFPRIRESVRPSVRPVSVQPFFSSLKSVGSD
jgi:hypothetical protein